MALSSGSGRLLRSRLSTALIASLLLPASPWAIAQVVETPTDAVMDSMAGSAAATADSEDARDLDEVAPASEAPAASGDAPVELEAMTVTGSRIRRTQVEGPAPVTVLTARDFQTRGFATLYDALRTLNQSTGVVEGELSQQGFTPNGRFVDLRGMGPNYQLILLNGRRLADYPQSYGGIANAVSLSAIPLAAVERVEVLSSGASSIYGSDAVAGVINIITRSNYEGDEVNVRGGATSRGGGESHRLQWLGGKRIDALHLTYAAEYLKRDAILGRDRDFMDSFRDIPNGTDPVLAGTGLILRNFNTGRNEWPDGLAATCSRFAGFEANTVDGSCSYPGHPGTQSIRNGLESVSGYLSGTYFFDNNLQAFGDLHVSRGRAHMAPATQSWFSDVFYDPNYDAPMAIARNFATHEIGGFADRAVRTDETAVSAAAGLRGTLMEDRFGWSLTASHSMFEVETRQPVFVTRALQDFFLGPSQGVSPEGFAIRPVDTARLLNPLTPAQFAQLNITADNHADTAVSQVAFEMNGELLELPFGPLDMAAVVEAARQSYAMEPDARLHPDYTGPDRAYNLTDTYGRGDRNRFAVGGEFRAPLLPSLKGTLAGRYDHYDDVTDVDGAATWSTGLEWRPLEPLLVRGTYGTSFRAPDMHFVFAGRSGFFGNIVDEYFCRLDGVDPTSPACLQDASYSYQTTGTRQGSYRLEEEKGRSTTLGVVADIVEGMSLSMDWYKLRLEGGVSDITPEELMRNEADCRIGTRRDGSPVDVNSTECQHYLSLVTRPDPLAPVTAIRPYPINQSMQKTSGLDVNWRYKVETRIGEINANLGWTHVLDFASRQFDDGEVKDQRDNRYYQSFRSRINWTAQWERDSWSAGLYGYRWGSFPRWDTSSRTAPYIVWNGNVQKRLGDRASVGLYVTNLFDKLAPQDSSYSRYPYFSEAFSPIGRELFLQFDYKLN